MAGEGNAYAALSMFSIQMPLKLLLYLLNVLKNFRSFSTSVLWELLHAMQIFRFMVMLNVHTPAILFKFTEPMEVAMAELEQLEEYTPKLFSEILFSFNEEETE